MAEYHPLAWWHRFLGLPNDSRTKTLLVAFLVALVSATAVSVTAVTLKPRQRANLDDQRQSRMAEMIATLPGLAELLREADAESLEIRLVDLEAGTFATDMDPSGYDPRVASSNPALSIALSPESDRARIGRRANFAPVHILRRGDDVALIVLPVHGSGYQSTVYAYLALESDFNTVASLTVYEHGETPGIGARVENPTWQALWRGKKVADETGKVRISVATGRARGLHEVDAISGATRTTTGLTNMLHFWLGERGFGPFLARLKAGEISP